MVKKIDIIQYIGERQYEEQGIEKIIKILENSKTLVKDKKWEQLAKELGIAIALTGGIVGFETIAETIEHDNK